MGNWPREAGHLPARGGRSVFRGRKGEWMDLELTVTGWKRQPPSYPGPEQKV